MAKNEETARAELIARSHKAARLERAEAIRSLWRKLLRRERQEWHGRCQVEPAMGDCR